MHKTRAVARAWMERLEHDPELFGLRLFSPDGGFIWRNQAAREFYEARGFFGSATTTWSRMKFWMTKDEILRLEEHYRRCFETRETVEMVIAAQSPGYPLSKTLTRMLAVYGTPRSGVIITHLQPLIV